MKTIIESPYSDGKARLRHQIKEAEFRGEKFKYYHFYYECEKTKKRFTTNEAGDLNYYQVTNQYRERKKMMFPEQIIRMRENYGLSAAKMSRILGFGPNTYSNYEKGEVPSEANAEILRLANNPELFRGFFVENKGDEFSKEQLKKLEERIGTLTAKKVTYRMFFGAIWDIWNYDTIPNEHTGYRAPNFEKFGNMVIYFAKHEPDKSYATRLNKQLFYADFLHFKYTGYSISGCMYHANKFGTVPIRSDISFALLDEREYLEKSLGYIDKNGEMKPIFRPNVKFAKELFAPFEITILETVFEKFKHIPTKDLVERVNHEERAWKELKDEKRRISYREYGFEIKGV
jgi:putative zinc finger/helix-turn-helix YgiT family protein